METRVIDQVEELDLEPGEGVRVERGPDGRLWAGTGDRLVPVLVRRCFPWSEPNRYISLRDDDEEEVALIDDPGHLDPDSRTVIETALADAGFVLQVTRVRAVTEEVEIRHWEVDTRQGPRTFQTRLDDWPRTLSSGGILIRDVGGDLYHIVSPGTMDPQSRELLWAFVD